ncbi:MAG: hypothetical protein KDB61_05560 [Planctomycetes bacterium]|nr:hypothetical protein [Planctomycetota bacterium]
MKTLTYLNWILIPFLALSCGSEAPEPPQDPAPASKPSGIVWLDADPGDSLQVATARNELADGVVVTIEGVIGGSSKPFIEGLSAFTLVDFSVPSCSAEEGCETPWDYCCAEPNVMASNTVFVEFRDGDSVRSESLNGVNGLKPLAPVAIHGTIERDPQGNVTLVASGIRVLSK